MTCPAKLAYRSLADIGPARICGSPVKPGREFCGQHDPAARPQRDASGRILPRPQRGALDCMHRGDARDAALFATFARMRLTVRGRHAILSGIAGFNRNVTGG